MPREIVTETSRDKSSGQAEKFSAKVGPQPCQIQIETCPVPECNLDEKYMKLFKSAFKRVEQIKKSLTYLHGLLGNTR